MERIAAGTGDAICHAEDGRVVFADDGLPGDVVEGTFRAVKKRFARLDVERLVERGAGTLAEPGCAIADACGGCRFWRATYPDELAMKFDAAEAGVLKLAGAVAWGRAERLSFAGPAHWRTRARVRPGARHTGYFARRSHDVVDAPTCPVLVPALDHARQALDTVVIGVRGIAQVRLELGDDGAVCACVDAERRGTAEAIAAELYAASRQPLPVRALVVDDGRDRVCAWGEDATHRTVPCGAGAVALTVPVGAFSQAHVDANRALQTLVVDAVVQAGATSAVDLFAGCGNLTFPLVGAGVRVVGVEGVPGPVASATAGWSAFAGATDDRASFEHRDLSQAPPASLLDVDAIITDPPRGGMTPALVEAIGASRARTVVYVSCDPPAMARDVALLTAAGFSVARWSLLDLFPRTPHVEAVVVLSRDADR